MKTLLLVSLGVLCIAGTALAGGSNAGTSAYLSWNATSNVTDLVGTGGAQNNLYVRYTRATAMNYKGGEVKIHWDPAGDGNGCWDLIGEAYKTSSGTSCTYLNRGTAVPVATVGSNTADIAWSMTLSLTTCTAGAVVQIQFENDTCADFTGCIGLDSATILDGSNAVDACQIAGPIATYNGGGTHHCQGVTATAPTTWGKIKSLY